MSLLKYLPAFPRCHIDEAGCLISFFFYRNNSNKTSQTYATSSWVSMRWMADIICIPSGPACILLTLLGKFILMSIHIFRKADQRVKIDFESECYYAKK